MGLATHVHRHHKILEEIVAVDPVFKIVIIIIFRDLFSLVQFLARKIYIAVGIII